MNKLIIVLVVFTLFLFGCGPPKEEQILTAIAMTETARPTNTSVPTNTATLTDTPPPTATSTPVPSDTPTRTPTATATEQIIGYIPGLDPLDIIASLGGLDVGFECSLPHNPRGYEYVWTCSSDMNYPLFLNILVAGGGRSETTDDVLTAIVIMLQTDESEEYCKAFLAYLATIPYDGATPEKARDWVEQEISKGSDISATKAFGPVTFKLSYTEGSSGLLNIERPE
jgi:hypothetical protein